MAIVDLPQVPGQSVPVRRPPTGWEVLTWAFLGLSAAVVVLFAVRIAGLIVDYRLVAQLIEDAQGMSASDVAGQTSLGETTRLLFIAVFLYYVAAYIGWHYWTGRLLGEGGADPKRVLSHWAMVVVQAGITVLALLAFIGWPAVPTGDDGITRIDSALLDYDSKLIVLAAVRFVVAIVLVIAIVALRARVRSVVATFPWEEGSPEAYVPPPPRQVRTWHRADDSFWGEVEAMRLAEAGDLPLLEVRGAEVHRWHLLTSAEAVAEVRAALAPGEVEIVVYSRAPAPVDQRVVGRTAGEIRAVWRAEPTRMFVGLIEEAETGTLRYDNLSTEDELTSWLPRARQGTRCGAYRTADPDSIRVLVNG